MARKMHLRCAIALLWAVPVIAARAPVAAAELESVEQWDVYEIALEGPDRGNPYLNVTLSADFHNGTETISVPGFYDGDGNYKIRFSPPQPGEWSYTTHSNRSELDRRPSAFQCVAATGENRGPLSIVNTFYLEYADGSPFYGVGTTAYQWTSVKQSIQQQTLKTLAAAPFNKVRMCFFPKRYKFGNDTEPWAYPFTAKNDFARPNFAFFQNFDKRVRQLLELGIQADVILFHPYDAWGYSQMGGEHNARYVRYMIARLSAYRNVWWSLANEWDIPRIKEGIDWEGIGTLLQREDPHQRFRGIHNWYASEDHFYDHSRPWITHTSTQTSQFYNATKWRARYRKPLLFDEMRYEGDVSAGWGNLSGEEMTSYFWMAGLSGGYGTHGDTFQNRSDDSSEVRWWAKGGLLVGTSPPRIAFFKSIMEAMPVVDMSPRLDDNGDPEALANNVYTLAKQGDVYLSYVADRGQEIQLLLAGESPYRFRLIDTWGMKVIDKGDVPPGPFSYVTKKRYEAIWLSTDR